MEEIKTFDWDALITKDEQFTIPPEGDYIFQVIDFERGYYQGSDKIPACNKAVLTLQLMCNGIPTTKDSIILCTAFEWKLSAFFRSIGLKKVGETFRMNWDEVIGKSGIAHFQPYSYPGKDGAERQGLRVTKYYNYCPEKLSNINLDDLEDVNIKDTPFFGGF